VWQWFYLMEINHHHNTLDKVSSEYLDKLFPGMCKKQQ
jgi:hypothetical protein